MLDINLSLDQKSSGQFCLGVSEIRRSMGIVFRAILICRISLMLLFKGAQQLDSNVRYLLMFARTTRGNS